MEIAMPSVRVNLRYCKAVWQKVFVALLRSSSQAQRQAHRRRTPTPIYHLGQRDSTRDLPLEVESRKLVCGSVCGGANGERGRHPVKASCSIEDPPYVPHLQGQAGG